MINPDEMPVWLAVPAIFLTWSTWAVCIARDIRRARRGR